MIIDLDAGLELADEKRRGYDHTTSTEWAENVSGPMQYDGNTHERVPKPIVTNAIPEGVDAYHKNYLTYLERCYAWHAGAVVAPHHLWYMVLSELAGHIKANAEHYRSLFTNAPEGSDKTEIVIVSGSLTEIDPQVLVAYLRHMVPVGTDVFLPTFSTATMDYDVAACAAFCDAMSPFYSYSMLLCGFPRIRLEGTRDDWQRFLDHLGQIKGHMDKAAAYLGHVEEQIGKVLATYDGEPDIEFWKGMFFTERCGSGSDTFVRGWITDFFMEQPSMPKATNFSSHIAKFEYKQLDTEMKYEAFHGLFSSRLDADGFLVPGYSHVTESRGKATEEELAKAREQVGSTEQPAIR